MIALGFIETKGLIPAIEAADVMLKSAHVYLLERVQVGAGLVTISIASEDVSSVSSAVEAGSSAVTRLFSSALISKHVIARPDLELEHILKFAPIKNIIENSEQKNSLDLKALQEEELSKNTVTNNSCQETALQIETVLQEKTSQQVPQAKKANSATQRGQRGKTRPNKTK